MEELNYRIEGNEVNLIRQLQHTIHASCRAAGWYTNLETGAPLARNVPEMLMLQVSEIAEAMEGHRKNLMDSHLPHRKSIEVELADLMIRTLDLAGYLDLDLGAAMAEKFHYNQTREDHLPENRLKENGKAY